MEKTCGHGEWHVTPQLLRSLELGEVDAGVCVTLLLEHLSRLCPSCGQGFHRFVQGAPAPDGSDEGEIPSHDRLIDEAAARVLEYCDLELEASRQRTALLSIPTHEQRLRALEKGGADVRNPALVEILLDHARDRIHDSPRDAQELAELAEAVALRLDPGGPCGEGFRRDRLTEARAHRANALRAQGDLKQAEVLLQEVEARLGDTFDPFLLAEVASFAASLAKDQRRLGAALERLYAAERMVREIDPDSPLLARLRLQLASVLCLEGRPSDAVTVVLEVVEGLRADPDRDLAFIARHNLVLYLCEAGRFEEAQRVLPDLEPLSGAHPRSSFRLRVPWRQGRVAHGLGDVETAEREYLAARDGFIEAGLGYDAALVALDLAVLYLEQGRTAEVREIAAWTATLFESQDVHRETLAALALFRRAALEDALTVAQLRRLIRHVASLRTGAAAEPVS